MEEVTEVLPPEVPPPEVLPTEVLPTVPEEGPPELKKKRAPKKTTNAVPSVRRRKLVEQPESVGLEPTIPAVAPLTASFFQELGAELRNLEAASRQKRLSSLSIV